MTAAQFERVAPPCQTNYAEPWALVRGVYDPRIGRHRTKLAWIIALRPNSELDGAAKLVDTFRVRIRLAYRWAKWPTVYYRVAVLKTWRNKPTWQQLRAVKNALKQAEAQEEAK